MRYLLAVALLCGSVAFAKDKPKNAYQDAVLVSFRDIVTGSSCTHSDNTSGDIDARTNDDGDTSGTVNATTNGTTNCADRGTRLYTIHAGNQTYVLRPAATKKQTAAAMISFGWSSAFRKPSVLAYQLPGTHILVRSDESGFYVKLGKRESKYEVVEAK